MTADEFSLKAKDLLTKAHNLLADIEVLKVKPTNDGLSKYKNSVKSEIKFLEKLVEYPDTIKPSHVSCSNIIHLTAIFRILNREKDALVYKTFPYIEDGIKKVIRVDVVTQNGSRWIKLKSGNEKTLNSEILGYDTDQDISDSSDSDSETQELHLPTPPIVKQARSLCLAAMQNPVHFKPPSVTFQFVGVDSVPTGILTRLQEFNVDIKVGFLDEYDLNSPLQSNLLNLDITTLLAMVSAMTHDFQMVPEKAYDSLPLKLQRKDELVNPLLPILKTVLGDKILVTCETAFQKFQTIMGTIAGNIENQRAKYLFDIRGLDCPLELLNPYPDYTFGQTESEALPWKVFIIPTLESNIFDGLNFSKLKPHNIDIFGTGYELKIPTVTSNGWIQRSLTSNFVQSSIIVHEPRCLIEQKWIKYS